MLANCYWLACASGILTFVAGFAVGSNNFSAAWAPAVGAKAITFRRAVVLGTICEALGCLVVGVRSTPLFLLNVIHYQAWIPSPQLAIFVIVCAQACASIWVLLATHFRLSASLLHATVGGFIGASMSGVGPSSINWGLKHVTTFPYMAGVCDIFLSMLGLPLVSILISGLTFLWLRTRILRDSNAFHRMLWWLPTGCCAAATIGTAVVLCHIPHAFAGVGLTWDAKITFGVVCGMGLVVCVAVAAAACRMQQTGGYQSVQRAPAQMYDLLGLDALTVLELTNHAGKTGNSITGNLRNVTLSKWQRDIHNELAVNKKLAQLHASAEVFDDATEEGFKWPLIALAIVLSFTHGAAVSRYLAGPFAAVCKLYNEDGGIAENLAPVNVLPHLVTASFGLALGCVMYSYNMTATLGVHFAKLTPTRSFAVLLSAAAVRLISLKSQIPDTVMQTVVCGIISVGAVEGTAHVNWRLLRLYLAQWVLTIPAVGVMTAAAFSYGAWAPNIPHLAKTEEATKAAANAVASLAAITGNQTALALASNITAFQQQDIFGRSGPLALAVQAVVCDVLHLGLNGTFLGNSSGPACSANMSHGLSTMTKGPGMPRPEIP